MTFITIFNFIRKYYWIVQVVMILILLFLLRQERRKTFDFQTNYRAQQQAIETWQDEAGKNRIRAEIAEVSAANAKFVLETNLKEAIQKEVGNLQRNLISYSAIGSSTSGTFHTGTVDTVYVMDRGEGVAPFPAKKFAIEKADLQFQGVYVPSLDTLMAEYKIIHNFEIFHYYRRPGKPPFNIFRRKQAVAEIRFDNPSTQGDSLYTITLERKKGLVRRLFSL